MVCVEASVTTILHLGIAEEDCSIYQDRKIKGSNKLSPANPAGSYLASGTNRSQKALAGTVTSTDPHPTPV